MIRHCKGETPEIWEVSATNQEDFDLERAELMKKVEEDGGIRILTSLAVNIFEGRLTEVFVLWG